MAKMRIDSQHADTIINVVYNSAYGERPNSESHFEDKLEVIRNHPSLKFYILPNCADTIYSRDSDDDLENETKMFLNGDNPALLLLGDSGSGKSTFCTHLSLKLIDDYKKNKNFVFILDGYDEIGEKINIYAMNRLSEWNAKVIITCRTQYLEKSEDYSLFSKAVMDGANLSKSNLKGVNLRNVFMQNTNLSYSEMENVKFGERPYLEGHNSDVESICFNP